MKLTRRRFLGSSAAAASLASLGAGCAWLEERDEPSPAGARFVHGVASGDPLTDRVVLWTRVTPPAGHGEDRLEVAWQLSDDPSFARNVAAGVVETGAARDFTVKVDASGLEPGSTYFYRFRALGQESPLGRTRTLPTGSPERLRFAFVSCANLPQGFFNAYRHLAQREDLDVVLHLGDYLYEFENGGYGDGTALGRIPEPDRELLTLADYRTRHAQYKRDPDLQALHAVHPMIPVWDDHESANDSWRDGAENHSPESEGSWAERKAAAIGTYHEWMPTRTDPAHPDHTWRSFRAGDLAEFVMLDTRLTGRDRQAVRGDAATMQSPERSLLGAEQEAWLVAQLGASQRDGVAWRFLGQQVPFASWAAKGAAGHPDKWDGYVASRTRLLDEIAAQGIEDVVVLTGDVHSSWAFEVPRDPYAAAYDPASGRGSLAVELITPAISSSTLGSFEGVRERYAEAWSKLPHARFMDLDHRGYVVVDVDRERMRAEWWFVDTVERRADGERLARALVSRRGSHQLEPA